MKPLKPVRESSYRQLPGENQFKAAPEVTLMAHENYDKYFVLEYCRFTVHRRAVLVSGEDSIIKREKEKERGRKKRKRVATLDQS